MRVTEKGQVTIPKDIRDQLNIGPGSEVEFVTSEDKVFLVKAAQQDQFKDFREWADSVAGTFDAMGMTSDQYMEWLRGPRDDLDRG
ncbi:AbrB/MazE/SpoVT family DNA-binding domain-containing protein [Rhizobium sp. NTR19]|uniref:AbrB/MazE/SpoVT family DNA-binding domain-containing protein n=1 Tax=Neorhizobium turbinariae TaxID=2937795 RepID=A0ABT0IMT8_9HYPH|nr:AbrB/MazE/SpoVT family DNA-binding domain-containing protein [Neorhizobium turbinariae]MCK8779200.1 AbrB/MazE/SpoVT family DNA-binding domain-containing protein [Neorhizobium turbinariae]